MKPVPQVVAKHPDGFPVVCQALPNVVNVRRWLPTPFSSSSSHTSCADPDEQLLIRS
jgi:hypothetical protein